MSRNEALDGLTIGDVAGLSGTYPERPLISNETNRSLDVPGDYPTIEAALAEIPLFFRGGSWAIRVDAAAYAAAEDVSVPGYHSIDIARESGTTLGTGDHAASVDLEAVNGRPELGSLTIHGVTGTFSLRDGFDIIGLSPHSDESAAVLIGESSDVLLENVAFTTDLNAQAPGGTATAVTAAGGTNVSLSNVDIGTNNVAHATRTTNGATVRCDAPGLTGTATHETHAVESGHVLDTTDGSVWVQNATSVRGTQTERHRPTMDFYLRDDFGDGNLQYRDGQLDGTYPSLTLGSVDARFRPSWNNDGTTVTADGDAMVLSNGTWAIAAQTEWTEGRVEATLQFPNATPTSGDATVEFLRAGQSNHWSIQLFGNTTYYALRKRQSATNSGVIEGTWPRNTAEHTVAAERSGDSWELFINGVSQGTATDAFDPTPVELLVWNGTDTDLHLTSVNME